MFMDILICLVASMLWLGSGLITILWYNNRPSNSFPVSWLWSFLGLILTMCILIDIAQDYFER